MFQALYKSFGWALEIIEAVYWLEMANLSLFLGKEYSKL